MAVEIGTEVRCGTCTHERGGHYISYGGTAGCMCRVGVENPIPCPCPGFMLTESEALRNEWRQEVGMRVYQNVSGRQRIVDRLASSNARLRGALRNTGALEMLAQCPECLAERTNGERHADDCLLVQQADTTSGSEGE
jgi:hypothetical protein